MTTRIDVQPHTSMVADDYADMAEPRAGRDVGAVMQSVRNFATLSEALRILGAAVILVSMSVFMLQGWQEGNDVQRYLLLLAQTGLLTLAGFALSHGMKETKGARLFFGLALLSVPANFTILSALLYSVQQWDGGLSSYPAFATWQIVDPTTAGITLLGAILALLPVTMFCFAIMARRSARTLSMHFLLINALLLVPIRSSALVGVIALTGTVYALAMISRLQKADRTLNTREGKFALAALFVPVGIILFRSLYFYEANSLLVALLTTAIYLTLRQVSMLPMRREHVANLLELASLPVAFVAALAYADAADIVLSQAMMAPVFALSFAAFALDVAFRTSNLSVAALSTASASIAMCISLVFNVTVNASPFTAFTCVIAGAVLTMIGRGSGDRIATIAGCLTVAAGIVFGLGEMLEMILQSSWVDLAVFGASAIILGSLLERHGATMQIRLRKWLAGVHPASLATD